MVKRARTETSMNGTTVSHLIQGHWGRPLWGADLISLRQEVFLYSMELINKDRGMAWEYNFTTSSGLVDPGFEYQWLQTSPKGRPASCWKNVTWPWCGQKRCWNPIRPLAQHSPMNAHTCKPHMLPYIILNFPQSLFKNIKRIRWN